MDQGVAEPSNHCPLVVGESSTSARATSPSSTASDELVADATPMSFTAAVNRMSSIESRSDRSIARSGSPFRQTRSTDISSATEGVPLALDPRSPPSSANARALSAAHASAVDLEPEALSESDDNGEIVMEMVRKPMVDAIELAESERSEDSTEAENGTEAIGSVDRDEEMLTKPAPLPLPPLLADLTCPICFEPPRDVVTTPCGHVLCGECLFQVAKGEAEKRAAEQRARRDMFRSLFSPAHGGLGASMLGMGQMTPALDHVYVNSVSRQMQSLSRVQLPSVLVQALQELGCPPLTPLRGTAPDYGRMAELLQNTRQPQTTEERDWLQLARATGVQTRTSTLLHDNRLAQSRLADLLSSLREATAAFRFNMAAAPLPPPAPPANTIGGTAANSINLTGRDGARDTTTAANNTADSPAGEANAAGAAAAPGTDRSPTNQGGLRRIAATDIDQFVGTCPVCRAEIKGGFFAGLKRKGVQGLKFKYGKPSDVMELRYGKEFALKHAQNAKEHVVAITDTSLDAGAAGEPSEKKRIKSHLMKQLAKAKKRDAEKSADSANSKGKKREHSVAIAEDDDQEDNEGTKSRYGEQSSDSIQIVENAGEEAASGSSSKRRRTAHGASERDAIVVI